MSTSQVKTQLHDYIDKADEKLLRMMFSLMQNYYQDENAIVAFTTTGIPLTKKQMVELSDEAVKSVENGTGLSSDDIRKLKANW